jgi:membrane fusion protein, multidrug efflux system
MRTTILHAFGCVLTAAAGLAAAGCDSPPPRAEPPPPKVTVARPEMRQVVDYDRYNGWLQPVETVDIRSRVRGHLHKVHFVDGDLVKKDQLLFELDPRPIQADVDRAKDQVKVYQAQHVAAAKEEARLKDLITKGGASKSQVEAAEATKLALEAQIDATTQEVTRQSLDLEYSKITAPIAGRIGRAMLTVGNLVNAGGTDPVLATIVSVDPVHVYFDVDERSLQRYIRIRGEATTRPAAVRESKLPFTFGMDTDEGFPHAAVIDFANNRVDPLTGTIQVRGVVPNPSLNFIPGSRVRIQIAITQARPAMLIPDTAILADQDKRYLLTLDDKNVVHRRDIQTGKLLDDGSRVIRAGAGARALTAEDWVITQGTQMARVNYPVDPVRPTTQSTASSPPAPPAGAQPAAAAAAAAR